jgi:hypothetical protein
MKFAEGKGMVGVGPEAINPGDAAATAAAAVNGAVKQTNVDSTLVADPNHLLALVNSVA